MGVNLTEDLFVALQFLLPSGQEFSAGLRERIVVSSDFAKRSESIRKILSFHSYKARLHQSFQLLCYVGAVRTIVMSSVSEVLSRYHREEIYLLLKQGSTIEAFVLGRDRS